MPLRWTLIPELNGRLAIGRAPGGTTGHWHAELSALHRAGFGLVVCLLEAHELEHLEGESTLAEYEAAVGALGMAFLHLPTEDFCAPSRTHIRRAAAAIAHASASGRSSYVHCMAGLGRAGTVAACLLVDAGMPPDDAIALVRWVRPGAIQSLEQEVLIRTLGGQP